MIELYITKRMTPEFAGGVVHAVHYTGEVTPEVEAALGYTNIQAGYDQDDKTIAILLNNNPFWLLNPNEWIITQPGNPPTLSFLPDAAFQVTYEPLHRPVVYH
jgi:hypothetical protein